MTTLDVTVTNDWVDIKSSLSLEEDLSYAIDNVQGSTVYIRHASSIPTTSLVGHLLKAEESDEVTIGSDGLWVRSSGADAKIVLTALAAETPVLTEHGAGAVGTGATPTTTRVEEDGVIVTSIKIDVIGLASVATANDVIGASTGSAPMAFIGRNVLANNGVIFKTEWSCLETPAGGDNDMNVVTNESGILEYNDAGGTEYIANGGDLVIGQTIQNLVPAITEGDYFYLTAGAGDVAAVYTAGQFLLKLYGHPALV